jgi:hypothetical protein
VATTILKINKTKKLNGHTLKAKQEKSAWRNYENCN